MRALLTSVLLILCACAFADEADRPVGQNCDLAAPPKRAQEEAHHGVSLLVFPPPGEIAAGYSGCQVVWIKRNKEATLAWIVVIQDREAVRVWSQDAEMRSMLGQ